jgi:hypothetical protein
MRPSRFIPLLIATSALGCGVFPAPVGAATQSSLASADSFVDASHPNSNHGAEKFVRVGGRPEQRAYLRFRIRPLEAEIERASLNVFVSRGSARCLRVRRVANRWRESTITWKQRPRATAFPSVRHIGRMRRGTWISLDVSSLVTRRGVYSFELSTTTTGQMSIVSKEGGSGSLARALTRANHAPHLSVKARNPPVNTTLPSVTGTPEAGSTFSANRGDWSGSSPMTFAYQWLRCTAHVCTAVPGATFDHYPIGVDDVGHSFRVAVIATNSAGSATVESPETPDVLAEPKAAVAFDIGAHEYGVSGAVPDYSQGGGATLWTKPGGLGDCSSQAAAGSPSTCEGLAQPGDTIMFVPGEWRLCGYRPTQSGSEAGGYVTWSAPNLGSVTLGLTATCTEKGPFIVNSNEEATSWADGLHYVAFTNLVFDGRRPDGAQDMGTAVRLRKYTHHFLFAHNIVRYTGANGVSCRSCDYVRYLDNEFYRNGDVDGNGWASAMNLHAADGVVFLDSYSGFHNIVARNFVSGSYDPYGQGDRVPNPNGHTDGNGGIYDCPMNVFTGGYVDVPKTLWADNVIWQNGGRGFVSMQANDQWYVNNTFIYNGLDPIMANSPPQLGVRDARRVYVINNLAVAAASDYTFGQLGESGGSPDDVTYAGNLAWGSGFVGVPAAWQTDTSKFTQSNPQLLGPLPSSADDAMFTAVPAWFLGDLLKLGTGSPAIDAGIDPRSLMNAYETADFERWGLLDAYGGTRPQ